MPSKDREVEVEENPSERRHRAKSERDPNRPHKSRSSRPKVIDPETGEVKHRKRKDKEREKDKSSTPSSSMADLVPEIARTASAPGATSRTSLPYPSFNKTYSKEAVNSRDDLRLKKSPYTPESTDVGSGETRRAASADFTRPVNAAMNKDFRPPSPPETEFSQQQKGMPARMAQVQEDVEAESRPSSRSSSIRRSKDGDARSKLSVKSKISEASKASTAKASPRLPRKPSVEEEVEAVQAGSSDSNVTSVAPNQDKLRPTVIETDSSPASVQDSSPRTPTQTPTFPPAQSKAAPSSIFEHSEAPSSVLGSAIPPPPPPPPMAPIVIPQVDYLLQNGGLLRPVSKTIISAAPNFSPNPNRSAPMPSEIEKIFGPYFNILDQYEAVINKNGSLAVATGYRSVARRLLDRLENVFNRDLSSEGCACVMCQNPDLRIHEGSRGLGWGEVLEWVSARRELPLWPAFDFATLGVKAGDDFGALGISGHQRNASDGVRPSSPIKIDPDIAEEFRDHYLAQSAKKKIAVNKWLSSCPQTAAAPPQEVDDETLSFAILTHLDQQDRPVFNALINGSAVPQPVLRAPTTTRKPRSEFMIRTVHSIQRLYRLQTPPRDPEAAVYLLKNPNIHNLLATMSSINASEWEILTSGRFDGFLWSGAEESMNNSPAVSRGPTPVNADFRSPMSPAFRQTPANASRTTTPFSPMRNQTFSPMDGFRNQTFSPSFGFPPSRGPTPMRHPVSNDEETEIQVLAEVEREIYLGMEALEDAFEGLHRKAEVVRRALRERGAGLSMSLQSRRTSQPDILRSTTPGWGVSQWGGVGFEKDRWEGSEANSESEWDADEGRSEIAPDDSASNISSSRHRRPKRRNERRTPAPVEEEDEDEDEN